MSYACISGRVSCCQQGGFSGTNLADELHIAVLDAVVDHLDVVAGTFVADPLAAGLAVTLSGDALEDLLDEGPGLLVAAGHQRGAVAGSLLAAGNAGADEAEALSGQVFCSPVGVGEVGVAAIDDDVSALEEGQERLDPVIDGLAGLDEEHHTARLLQLGDELLGGVRADDALALGLVGQEAVDLGDGAVEGADGEAVVGHVENQVLAPGSKGSVSPPRCYLNAPAGSADPGPGGLT